MVRFFFSPHAVSLIKPSLRVSLLSLAKEEEAPPAKKVEKTKDPNLSLRPCCLDVWLQGMESTLQYSENKDAYFCILMNTVDVCNVVL